MAKKKDSKLLKELIAELLTVIGERGDNEGAVEVVQRLIRETRPGGKRMPLPKKGYIGWIVSRLYRGKRRLVFATLSKRRSDAIQDYLDSSSAEHWQWEEDRKDPKVKARVHKVTEIKIAK